MAKHVLQNPTMHDIFVVGGNIKGSYFKEEFIEISGYTKVIVDVKIKFGKLNIQNLYTNKYRKYYECILDDFAKICEN